ncbi:MAG: 4Fe-4S binding protein [Pirellulales bacterium]|nr:4Fe-4S binding protein [Pirellulales bacterium]
MPDDFPAVAKCHLDLAQRLSSPVLMGPPLCDELVALVEHTFSHEEAELARHLGVARGRSAADLARAERREVEAVQPLLDEMAERKHTIISTGADEKRRYRLLPIMPGMFEMVLISQSPDSMSDWHRRFAELIEALFETGYHLEYLDKKTPTFARFLPIGGSLAGHPMALPSDRLEVILDRYDRFAVANCQCRMTSAVNGQPCDGPLEVCTVMGKPVKRGVAEGWAREVSREEILQIKREAEKHGLVSWVMNIESTKVQVSCSCCGCCCKAMRLVNEFNAPAVLAPPHFMPRFDETNCTHCGRCATRCPMGAITVDTAAKTIVHQPARCIGCGLCQLACEKQQAIEMTLVPDYRLPYKSWYSFISKSAPWAIGKAWKTWRNRR